MRKFMSNNESIITAMWGEEIRIDISGWACFEGTPIEKIVVTVNGKQMGKADVTMTTRPDVLEAFPKFKDSGDVGYHVIWVGKTDEIKKTDRVSIVAICKDSSSLIWKSDNEGIGKNVAGKTIQYHVDMIRVDKKTAQISGWAVSGVGERRPEIKVCDPAGKPVEIRRKDRARIDAAKALFGEDADPNVGFDVTFECEYTKKYTIVFINSMEECREELDIPAEWKAAKKRNKLYLPAGEIIKRYSGSDFKDDLAALKRGGFTELKDGWKVRYATRAAGYEAWYLQHRATKEMLKEQKNTHFDYEPLISIIVPAYQTPKKFLKQMIESVQEQTYGNWQLCIADGSDKDDSVRKAMAAYRGEKRIRYRKLKENKGISGNTNAALRMASGDVITLLDHDDILAPDALFELVKAFNIKPEIDVVYTDEDKVSMDLATHFDPHFKTDFNLDLFRSNNYICHLFAAKKEIVDKVKGFRKDFDGSQDYDFILRCTELAREIHHIPKILYHWRMHMNSTAANPESKMYCYEAGKRAIEAHLKRVHQKATVTMTEHLGYYHIDYEKKEDSLVSILIPNKDEAESLQKCVDSIIRKTKYPNYEIIIIENNSTTDEIFELYKELEQKDNIRVVTWKDEFNYSAINNFGASFAKGEYLLLLNNDTEIIEPRWLDMMLADCQRDEVGIVGAKLLYPDDTIQHCGVIIGLGGVAGHVFVGENRLSATYFAGPLLQQDFSAVTAACLMIPKELFDEVGGLDERVKVAFNDVDFCLRVRETGKLVMMDPRVLLYHYESKSRGTEDTPEKQKRFESEVNFMKERWADILEKGDPYYNPNLTLTAGDCSLRADE